MLPFSLEIVMKWDVEVAKVYTLHTDTSGDLGQISDHP